MALEVEKDTDEGGATPTQSEAAQDEGPPGVGGGVPPEGGEGSLEQEGAQEPRHSNRENQGVPPLRFAEMMAAAAEAADGGAPMTY